MFKKFIFFVGLFVVLLASYFAIQPFFHSGFFSMHDDTQVARVFEMSKSLKDGTFPVRWVSDLGYGYGYPIFNFYGPFAYYIGAVIIFLGVNALLATKIMMIVGVVFAGISMYILVNSFAGEISGVIGAVFYLYAPYHALDIYVRGDVGEFWAYAFIPLFFFALLKIYQTKKWKYVILGAFSFLAVIASHNLTAFMLIPFISIFIITCGIHGYFSKNIFGSLLQVLSCFFGLLISSFYFLPALLEIKYTNVLLQLGGSANPLNHFICLSQFWYSPWGYGGSAPGCVDGLSFALGKIIIILLIIAFICLPLVYFKNKKVFPILLGSLLLTVFSLFLTTEFSSFIWKNLPFMAFFQYPWRFLIMAAFFSSISISLLPLLIKNKIIAATCTAVILVMLIFMNMKIFIPQNMLQNNSDFYTNTQMIQFTTSKISDEYLPKNFEKITLPSELPQSIFYVKKFAQIHVLVNNTQNKIISITSRLDQRGFWNIAYFPGWTYSVDSQEVIPQIFPRGIAITVPQGTHILEARYTATTVENVSNFISIAGVICLLLGIIRKPYKRQN